MPVLLHLRISKMFSLLGLATILLVSVTKVNSLYWDDFDSLRVAVNCDWNGGDIGNIQSVSGLDCMRSCLKRPDCTKFTWTTSEEGVIGTCWLKSGDNSESNAITIYDRNKYTQCGYKTDANRQAAISTNQPQVTVAPVPTAQPAESTLVVTTKSTVTKNSSQSVFEKNPWLKWVLIGAGLIVIFPLICCFRPYLVAKISSKKIENKELEGKKVENEENTQTNQTAVASFSVGPPKPI